MMLKQDTVNETDNLFCLGLGLEFDSVNPKIIPSIYSLVDF